MCWSKNKRMTFHKAHLYWCRCSPWVPNYQIQSSRAITWEAKSTVNVTFWQKFRKWGYKMFEPQRPLRKIKPLHHNQVEPNSGPRTSNASSMRSRVMFTNHGKRKRQKDGLVPWWLAEQTEPSGRVLSLLSLHFHSHLWPWAVTKTRTLKYISSG